MSCRSNLSHSSYPFLTGKLSKNPPRIGCSSPPYHWRQYLGCKSCLGSGIPVLVWQWILSSMSWKPFGYFHSISSWGPLQWVGAKVGLPWRNSSGAVCNSQQFLWMLVAPSPLLHWPVWHSCNLLWFGSHSWRTHAIPQAVHFFLQGPTFYGLQLQSGSL